jgi:hypothetical protein
MESSPKRRRRDYTVVELGMVDLTGGVVGANAGAGV